MFVLLFAYIINAHGHFKSLKLLAGHKMFTSLKTSSELGQKESRLCLFVAAL